MQYLMIAAISRNIRYMTDKSDELTGSRLTDLT